MGLISAALSTVGGALEVHIAIIFTATRLIMMCL